MYSFPSLPLFIRLFNFFNSFVLVLLLLTANLWLIFKFTVSLADKSDELNMKKITIAIDGFSSCGKSTMAKDLAREVGYIYIDSGAMYRAVTLYSIENGIFDGNDIDTEKLRKEIRNIRISFRLNPATGQPDTYLNDVNVENRIRTMEVSSKVSPISALDFVRTEMVAQQQAMGKEKGIVMDGRDIGTTVFPEAELKIFARLYIQIIFLRDPCPTPLRRVEGERPGSQLRRDSGERETTGLYRPASRRQPIAESRGRSAAG